MEESGLLIENCSVGPSRLVGWVDYGCKGRGGGRDEFGGCGVLSGKVD